MFSGDRELLLLLYVWKFVECRINTNTRTYSHPGGRPRGEGLAPPLRKFDRRRYCSGHKRQPSLPIPPYPPPGLWGGMWTHTPIPDATIPCPPRVLNPGIAPSHGAGRCHSRRSFSSILFVCAHASLKSTPARDSSPAAPVAAFCFESHLHLRCAQLGAECWAASTVHALAAETIVAIAIVNVASAGTRRYEGCLPCQVWPRARHRETEQDRVSSVVSLRIQLP